MIWTISNTKCAIAELTLFAISKDEWDITEDNGKSIKNALYVLQCTKVSFEPVALAIVKLR